MDMVPEDLEAALKLGSADLKYLLAREGVDEKLQGAFFSVGITTLAKFSTIVDTAAEFKKMLKEDFALDAAADLQTRVRVAAVVVAYNSAKARTEKFAELEGEMQSKRLQKPLAVSEYQAMRTAWEKKWWPQTDGQTPGRSYMEKRADDLANGDLRAEPLTSVISREEDNTECFQSFWDAAGQLQLKKGGTSVAEPQNPEQLRKRIKLMGCGLMMLGIRHTNNPALQGLVPQDFEDYLSFLLGEFVWGLTGRSADGNTVALPSWAQLIIYEYQIRRAAYRLVEEGSTFKDALKQSYKDAVTKERYFTTPIALSSSQKRPYAFNDMPDGSSQKKGKSKGAGKGGKSGGKGRKGNGKPSGKPEGKKHDFCYAYNNSWERCKNKNCKFKHQCMKCGGNHPVYNCTNAEAGAKQGGETQGKGAGAE